MVAAFQTDKACLNEFETFKRAMTEKLESAPPSLSREKVKEIRLFELKVNGEF